MTDMFRENVLSYLAAGNMGKDQNLPVLNTLQTQILSVIMISKWSLSHENKPSKNWLKLETANKNEQNQSKITPFKLFYATSWEWVAALGYGQKQPCLHQ